MKLPFISEKKQDSSEPEGDTKKHSNADSPVASDQDQSQSIRGLSDLYSPEEASESSDAGPCSTRRDIIAVLVDMGKLTPQQHTQLRQEQSTKPGRNIETLLLQARFCNADDILMAQAELYGLEFKHI